MTGTVCRDFVAGFTACCCFVDGAFVCIESYKGLKPVFYFLYSIISHYNVL